MRLVFKGRVMEGSLEEKQTQCIKGWATCKLQEVNWRRCLGVGRGAGRKD